MSGLLQDLRHAARQLVRQPGFTAAAVLALALGIGANTAMFSIVDGVLLRPLPYQRADELVMVWNLTEGETLDLSEQERLAYRAEASLFDGLASFDLGWATLTEDGPAERQRLAMMNADMLPLLGVAPVVGRNFTAAEDAPGRDDVVLLGEGLWRRRYAGDPAVVGRRILVDGAPRTVIGVLPDAFRLPLDFGETRSELFVPLALEPIPDPRNFHELKGIARLRSGVSVEEAERGVATVAARLRTEIGTLPPDFSATVRPLREEIVGDIRPALLVTSGAVGLLLLLACANVANLLLARAETRQHEFAVRAALGAGRLRLVRQLLTESLLLSALGAGLGLFVAVWSVQAVVSLAPTDLPRLDGIAVNGRVLGFTILVAVATGLVFGLVPAFQTRGATAAVLREDARSGRRRARRALVAAEVGLAVMLAVGAALMLKSFARLQRVDGGFEPERVLTLQISLPDAAYEDKVRVRSFYATLLERVRALPGVRSAGAISNLPLGSQPGDWGVIIEGRPRPPEGQRKPFADWQIVTGDYFRTMGIPLRAGRVFAARDDVHAPDVVVINEAMARRYWPDESPVGARFRFTADIDTVYRTVIGVVGDVHQGGLAVAPKPEMYLPHAQFPRHATWAMGTMTLVLRTPAGPEALAGPIRAAVQGIDADVPLTALRPMRDVVAASIAVPRLHLLLLGAFALIALALVATGVYAVIAFMVAQRTREIGIRMALGADPAAVRGLVLGEAAAFTLAGLGAGLVGAVWLARALGHLLYDVRVLDPAVFVTVPLLLAGVALLATYIPARRATRVDPLVALRSE